MKHNQIIKKSFSKFLFSKTKLLFLIVVVCLGMISGGVISQEIITVKTVNAATVIFSDIEDRVIRDTSVNILWHTDIPATGQIEYGLDTNYGNLTDIEDLARMHSMKLTGLTPGTTYHYRLRAVDYYNNEEISGNYTFTTLAEMPPPSITGTSPNFSGNTDIYDDTIWANENFILNGNVTIYAGGSLTLNNTTLIFASTETVSYGIYVKKSDTVANGGRLKIINSSNVTAENSDYDAFIYAEYKYPPSSQTPVIQTSDSYFSELSRGIEMRHTTSESYFDNITITNSYYGIYLGDGGEPVNITNCKIENTSTAIHVKYIGAYIRNNTITNMRFGVYTYETNGLQIIGNTFDAEWYIGNYVIDIMARDKNFIIKDNIIKNFQRGIVLNGSISDGLVENNIMVHSNGGGIGMNDDVSNIIVRNNYFDDVQDPIIFNLNYAKNFFNWTIEENVIINPRDTGMELSAFSNSVIRNNTITNTNQADTEGIKFVKSITINPGVTISDNVMLSNISISGFKYGLSLKDVHNYMFVDISINNSSLYDIEFTGDNTNNKFINTLYNSSKVYFNDNEDTFLSYYYFDVKVEDSNGNSIQDAIVTITNDIDTNYPSININGETKSSFTTGTDGHTPLPTGNEADSIAMLDYWQNNTTKTEMTYAITAEKDGYTQTVTGINPDSTWHRENPDTYQNTTTIVLDMEEEDTTPPICSSGSPTGTLSSGTTSATLSLSTNETATCKYSTIADTVYSSIANTFTSTNSTSHSTTITGLTDDNSYTYYIRCIDASDNANANTSDYTISFSVASAPSNPSGGGGTTPTIDTTQPTKVTNFTASAGDQEIVLTWQNPTDSDYVRTKILRKEDDYPANTEDGELVYDGNEETYTDTGLTNNTAYYYSAFTYDAIPNYSDPATASSTPEEGKVPDPPSSDPDPEEEIYPEGTLLQTPDSFKIYVIINQKKKWIPTPEVFETLGYQWGNITQINTATLNAIPNYEDNLIRTNNDYKVYLVVNGIKRHIPNPEIFLNYGFAWDDVVDVPQATIGKYTRAYLVRESRQEAIYYLRSDGVKKHIRNPEIFSSYNNSWDDIQVISKYEMDFYPESNLIQLSGDNRIYLLEGNIKRYIPTADIFNRYGYNWEHVVTVNKVEFDFYGRGGELR